MRGRLLPVSGLLLLLGTPAPADEGIAPATLDAVKRATVFVRVDGRRASGTGFVVAADGDGVLIATNHHVIAPPGHRPPARPDPGDVARGFKQVAVDVVFDAGTRDERAVRAEPVAADPEVDLAVLKVVGLADPPAPVAYADPPRLTETMPVYTFGYPFGQLLATGRGAPAITVGKATISSLRLNPDGDLAVVQLDGNLNPGNSGGPVVDVKGRLAGIAVATIRNGQGIGLAIPAAELGRVMRGRLGPTAVPVARPAVGRSVLRPEVAVVDPTGAVRGVTLNYLVVGPKGAQPPPGVPLAGQPGVRSVPLKLAPGVATGEIAVDTADGDVYVQAVPDGGGGGATRVERVSLTAPRPAAFVPRPGPGRPARAAGPPDGWKEFSPKDKGFVVWVPEKAGRQSDRERFVPIGGQRVKVTTRVVEAGGLTYRADTLVLPEAVAALVGQAELEVVFRNAMLAEARAKVVEDASIVTMGQIPGKEYLIKSGQGRVRSRVFVVERRVIVLMVTGTLDQVMGKEGQTFLASCRLPGRGQHLGDEVVILGGAFDPEFRDTAPDGGLLVGFEFGLGKFLNQNVIRYARPIYRVGGKEVTGEEHGTNKTLLVTVKARPGYAVGGMAARHGLGCDGVSVLFMKVADGKLDPADAYESVWVGSEGDKMATRIGGDGTPVIGIVGKFGPKDLTGLGLLFKPRPGAAAAGKE